MHHLASRLSALVLGTLLCLVPAFGAPLGGNDSGVWILPRAAHISTGFANILTGYSGSSLSGSAGRAVPTPRMSLSVASFAEGLTMRVGGMGLPPIVTIRDVVSGRDVPLTVTGGDIMLPPASLHALAQLPSGRAAGLAVDSAGHGYALVIRREVAGESLRLVFEIY